MDAAEQKYGPIFAKYSAMSIEQVAQNDEAMKMGARLFANYCTICHGSDAKGAMGFPNLTDSHWRWGGEPAAIKTTILNGRIAAMPGWGQVIGEEGVKNVAAYVRQDLAGLKLPEGTVADVEAGKAIFAQNCVACHGQKGEGMAMMGAPDLTAPSGWIYGSGWHSCSRPSVMAAMARCLPRSSIWARTRSTCWRRTFTACRTKRNLHPTKKS